MSSLTAVYQFFFNILMEWGLLASHASSGKGISSPMGEATMRDISKLIVFRCIAQLVATNNPDKIIFVGEALVGNEAVDQLTKFDRALRDFSAASGAMERGIDGMLVTKWDTVDDKVRWDTRLCAFHVVLC